MDAYEGGRQLRTRISVDGVGLSIAIGIRKRRSSIETTTGERVEKPEGSSGALNSGAGVPIESCRDAKPVTDTLIRLPSGAT